MSDPTPPTALSGCRFAHADGAYVLGALAPAERLEFERHLAGCAACSRSVRELAGLPGLLGRVSLDDAEGPRPIDPLPETVLPALVGAVRREQRRRLVTLSLSTVAAVAATVAIVVGSIALQSARDGGATPEAAPTGAVSTPSPARPMTALGDDGVSADVSLTSVGWGTKLDLTCTYGDRGDDYGGGEGARFALVIRTRAGATEQVASWQALPGRTLHLPGSTGTATEDIAEVEVRTASGRTVLRLGL